MKIPCKVIAEDIEASLKKQVLELKEKGKKPHLVDILIGDSSEQLSFVAIKQKMAKKLGIGFECAHYTHVPIFEKFANILKQISHDPKVTGIIIQQPLPPQLQTDSLYRYIPIEKEIEGHKQKSPFHPPLGQAVLTVLKHIYSPPEKDESYIFDMVTDGMPLRKVLKHKKLVLIGRGITGGQPIGKTLTQLKINYLSINSKTHEPQQYYREADILITAAGKKVLTKDMIAPGTVLINVGLRKENEKLKGDYDEHEIASVASQYTATPGGVGPLEVLYLFKNLLQATDLQLK